MKNKLFSLSYIFLFIFMDKACNTANHISSFNVVPTHICANENVHLSWVSDGADPIVISGYPFAYTATATTGNTEGEVAHSTDIMLSKGDAPTVPSVHIDVVPAAGEDIFMSSLGDCVSGTPTWRIIQPPNDWGEAIRVNTVTNDNAGFSITVAHSGHFVSLPSGASTTEFSGTKPSGDWSLTTPLTDPTVCAETSTSGHNPNVLGLKIRVNVVCQH